MDEKNEEPTLNQEVTELKSMLTEQLRRLGNQAVKRGLISGHGYYEGRYEILCNGQIFHLSPEEAHSYLKNLVERH